MNIDFQLGMLGMLGLPEIAIILMVMVVGAAVVAGVIVVVLRLTQRSGMRQEARASGLATGEFRAPSAEANAAPGEPVKARTENPAVTPPASCPRCGTSLATGSTSQGLCPKCLLDIGMGTRAGTGSSPVASSTAKAPSIEELSVHFPALEILEMLGQGGMGMVYKARQRALDRLVALKVLPQDAARDPAFAERFQREARALARLSHPNIVAVHEFGETAGYYYLVMEFVDGSDLRRVLQQRKLSAEEALRIVPAICDALQYAHASGVVHRDIKPGNILLDRDGRVKIADFGIAKLVGGESPDPTLTQLRQRMGTPHYMAPEQVENPQAVDHRADIFSLGVVFYEMLTGELPLGRFPVPSAKVQVDVRLDEVVLRALEKEPARRYQQAGEVKTEVERISAAGSESRPPRRVAGLTGIGGFGHSEKAVFAMVWAVLLFPLFLVFWSVAARSGRSLPTGIMSVFFLGFVVVCGLAPLGTTLLGMLALRDLCRERRGGAGLGLALVASGLFPTMTLLIAVFGLWALVFGLTIGHAASVMVAPLALVATVATGGPLVVWLGARFWRRAHAAAQNPEAPTGTPIRRWWRSAAVLGSQAVVGFLLVAAFVASTGQSRRPAVNRAPVLERMSTDLATGLPVWVPTRGWEMTTNGPVVTEALSWELPGGMGLQEPQRSALNRALQDGWNEYRKLLASRVSVLTNALGHFEVEVTVDLRETESLESRFWTAVDPMFDRVQQGYLRRRLLLRSSPVGSQDLEITPNQSSPPLDPQPAREGAEPLFALESKLTFEFWRVGAWYHWRVRPGGMEAGTSMEHHPTSRGPEVPWAYRPLIEIVPSGGPGAP